MTDTRFTTAVEDQGDLVGLLDLDGIADLETLLMVLLDRPVEIEQVPEDDGTLQVLLQGDDVVIGCGLPYPFSILELVSSCAETAEDLGPYTGEGASGDAQPDVLEMDDSELITALQQGLGLVRMFNLMQAGE